MPPVSKPSSAHPDILDLPELAFPPLPVEPGRHSTQTTRLLRQSPSLRYSGERVERIREGMVALSLLEHKLWLPASKLGLPLEDAIRGELESIFLDKVITKLDFCVSIYDIKSIDGGFILPNEGSPTYMVVFRVIMFRPYVGEVISAKLKESNTNGLHCKKYPYI
ncbi:hypothetical protein Cgig2_007195 [Carnegiea gigantea]|uniref:DNA-directed RNA polymerase subunit n=1 Tax=Carnegiea gigantea TaxID=171969 RepID=A0A9Q1JIP4_9CARY|nr:hypothetical protein Cgig2_007195 [Carnegiea gigantea]